MGKKRTTTTLPPEMAEIHDALPAGTRRYLFRLLRLNPPTEAPPYVLRGASGWVRRSVEEPDTGTMAFLTGRWPTLSAAWSDALRVYGKALLENRLRLSGADMDMLDTLWPPGT